MKVPEKKLIQLPVRDFAKKQICDGHLYLINKDGRKFYLMKPGVFVDPAFVKKHATHNTIFDFSSVINEEVKKSFVLVLKELRYLQFEKDLRLKAIEIIKIFETFYSSDEHFLTFALACQEVFCDLPLELLEKMHETDMYLFRKSLYSASFAVIIAISNDLYNPMLLKDFFNLTFMLDIGLCESDYSYYVSQACNQENTLPGSGKDWLKANNATDSELKVFLGHPEKSYQLFKQNGFLAFPELAEITLYQHELSDGKGFPRGVPKGLISSWESIVMLADSMVEIQAEYNFEQSIVDYVFNFKNQKLADIPVSKVYKKFCQSLIYFKQMKETGS
ncbi:MAG TPA: HD domain-containing phosphohydrolase [Bacteriovoracaceae bacterium]|nr:HD domain-containing phosphohydrolase [Bacteriovoracaceae bacterium]